MFVVSGKGEASSFRNTGLQLFDFLSSWLTLGLEQNLNELLVPISDVHIYDTDKLKTIQGVPKRMSHV